MSKSKFALEHTPGVDTGKSRHRKIKRHYVEEKYHDIIEAM